MSDVEQPVNPVTGAPSRDMSGADFESASGEATLEHLGRLVALAVAGGSPVEISKGAYGIYATPEGGMHIVYRPKGVDEDAHLPIPPAMMRMMLAKGTGGGRLNQLKALIGLGS